MGGIHQSDSAALGWLISRQVCFLKQTPAKLLEPLFAFAQAFEQGHIRKLRQMRLSRSHYRLAQRITASQVDQERPQAIFLGLVLP
jgi:hypothetical protein